MTNEAFFLPYQQRWLNDKSRIKIWEKSRRIGATYTQSYEDVEDALLLKINNKPCDVWFSSADESAAREYIGYCEGWAKLFNAGCQKLGEIVIDEEKDIKAFSLEFKNGARINALSSNPARFRSKGGKVVLDEYAHHKRDAAMWTAASPSALIWNYPLRILSTHNGQICKYFQFINDIRNGKLKWGLHSTPIQKAVEEGLADKVLQRKLTEKEREDWLKFIRDNAGDELTWLQEYCCVAVEEALSFLTFNMLEAIKEPNVLRDFHDLSGELYIGFDVARKKHLSVFSVIEKFGSIKYVRQIIEMSKWRFRDQKELLYKYLTLPNVRRARIDATGIGAQLAEDAHIDFGHKVEEVNFTASVKEDIAYCFYTNVEDRSVRVDTDTSQEVINDFHSIKKFVTSSNNIRFDSDGSTDGHADRFWSVGLALTGADNKTGFKNPVIYTAHNMIKNYRPSLSLPGFGRKLF